MLISDWCKIKIKHLLLKILYAKHDGIRKFSGEYPWVDPQFQNGDVIFTHGGGIGDILFSLYFCKELSEFCGKSAIHYHILTNTYDPKSRTGYNSGVSRSVADFLQPLLASQPYITQVICDAPPAGNVVELNDFRKLKINFYSGDIRNWYYNLTQHHLPREFWKPVIFAEPDFTYRGKVIICLTPRYRNVNIDCRKLEPFRKYLIFAGIQPEYEDFKKEFFEIPFLKCENMLQLAQYMAGAKGFIGNQSGIYSLAECMKLPRILLAPDFVDLNGVVIPGPHNNHPQGGWCESVSSTEKMIAAVTALLSKE